MILLNCDSIHGTNTKKPATANRVPKIISQPRLLGKRTGDKLTKNCFELEIHCFSTADIRLDQNSLDRL